MKTRNLFIITVVCLPELLGYTRRYCWNAQEKLNNTYDSVIVTKNNFDEVLPVFQQNLKNSLFTTFDFELTGLTTPDSFEEFNDSEEERYAKLARSVRSYVPIQFGVTLWRKEVTPDNKTIFIANPYCFYLAPRGQNFTVSMDAFDYLAANNYDFNTTFSSGISFNKILSPFGVHQVSLSMIENKKPLIGHNCLIDLFHFYQHFHQELPISSNEFRENYKKLFPLIMDTKIISQNTPALHSLLSVEKRHLGDLYELIKQRDFFKHNILVEVPSQLKISFSSHEQQMHNAGFDAFMTGVVFLGLTEINGHTLEKFEPNIGHPLVTSFGGLVNVMKSQRPYFSFR